MRSATRRFKEPKPSRIVDLTPYIRFRVPLVYVPEGWHIQLTNTVTVAGELISEFLITRRDSTSVRLAFHLKVTSPETSYWIVNNNREMKFPPRYIKKAIEYVKREMTKTKQTPVPYVI